ncbi:hypothetical protein QNH20_07890 [Neobacillus sp. WH10]|uniref:hypothetical protein n=1 Tax=Neobacillus sp. WH10 TaxID=3047873 RepID=UPI0024C1C109|nr:hypothetical protein [Neobacillus sp. WH10]WHY79039.1 hypothetical protein QNH20_07890 [Neobacillus sp. WH10]
MKQAFIKQLDKQGIKLTFKQLDKYLDDFRKYCEEMEFASEAEISEGAIEYLVW